LRRDWQQWLQENGKGETKTMTRCVGILNRDRQDTTLVSATMSWAVYWTSIAGKKRGLNMNLVSSARLVLG
jgi:hypothetical protein